jgi:hypothetical protein
VQTFQELEMVLFIPIQGVRLSHINLGKGEIIQTAQVPHETVSYPVRLCIELDPDRDQYGFLGRMLQQSGLRTMYHTVPKRQQQIHAYLGKTKKRSSRINVSRLFRRLDHDHVTWRQLPEICLPAAQRGRSSRCRLP